MISNQTLSRNPQKEEENSHWSHAIIQNLDQNKGDPMFACKNIMELG
jgi:hypothetical protein